VDVDQLVGAEEIAERLGLSSYQRVHELRRRNPDFPAPVAQTKRTMIWSWPDVERWWKNRNKRLNR
jgi:hypothetical protein